ncbi:MAG TPA: radical SAM protein [Terracidiphilus sp.]|nr:radical SAM protein [Terracidiphilus sp.]
MHTRSILQSWGKVLRGHTPLLSIEITRECPLHCPGCYAYGSNHLGGDVTLRELNDKRGEELVRGVLELVDRHQPLQVTLVGGEPMVRHRELSHILPELSSRGIFSMIVTSGIIPIPLEWMRLSRFTAAVSIDGLPEHHNVRRHPATYERILTNIAGRRIYVHYTITAQMLQRPGYLEEYMRFWSERDEVHKIWVSLYSPQRGEESAERLSQDQREFLSRELPRLRDLYPKLLTPAGYGYAFLHPPASPKECTFSRLSKNYSADLRTHVEPCVFGGDPDCSQCGCAASAASHWISGLHVAGPLKAGHLLHGSMRIGSAVARLRHAVLPAWREREQTPPQPADPNLVQISME